ncbi:MAG: hypothetical protein R3Y62_00760 [Eubacteriales bacterium]
MSNPPEEKKKDAPLDEKRKNAVMRYIFILFAVAFLLILLTYFIQLRDSNQTISDLAQSSASAMQNAEKLQDDNRLLATLTDDMEQELEDLTAQSATEIQELSSQLALKNSQVEALITDVELLEAMTKDTLRIYEALLSAENALSRGDIAGAKEYLPSLGESASYLGNEGVARYENLLVAIELAETANEEEIPE